MSSHTHNNAALPKQELKKIQKCFQRLHFLAMFERRDVRTLWLDSRHQQRERRYCTPRRPKSFEHLLAWFYARLCLAKGGFYDENFEPQPKHSVKGVRIALLSFYYLQEKILCACGVNKMFMSENRVFRNHESKTEFHSFLHWGEVKHKHTHFVLITFSLTLWLPGGVASELLSHISCWRHKVKQTISLSMTKKGCKELWWG